MSKRRAWFEAQPDLDPARLVFIDETWTATNMARMHGRSARGERLRMGFPHGHRKTTTPTPLLLLVSITYSGVLSRRRHH